MKLIQGDCLEVMKTLEDNSVDAVVTDPPYGLSFMGKKWDYDVPSIEIWQEALRVLKPGGYLLAFAGTRTQHRMAVRIEDAGFEIRDMIAWIYGSGFPKSLNIGNAVNTLQGNNQDKLGSGERETTNAMGTGLKNRCNKCGKPFFSGNPCRCPKPKYDNAWEGWGTALKPALEPITVARKPLSEPTVAKNVLKWGTGGINIDASRVPGGSYTRSTESMQDIRGNAYNLTTEKRIYRPAQKMPSGGRFPANLIHNGSDEVLSLFPMDKDKTPNRFFYCAKASKSERNRGCEELAEQPIAENTGENHNVATLGRETKYRNNHPTVKPIALMEYLVKLVSREGAVVLDPFIGSGTTGIACKNMGRDFIGIELIPEYMEIAKARIGE